MWKRNRETGKFLGPEKTDSTLVAKQVHPETEVCSVEVAGTQTEGDFDPAKQ